MQKVLVFLTGLWILGASQVSWAAVDPAVAAEGEKLVKASDCFQCHRIPTKLIGPSYKDVANKYKDADEAKITELAGKVVKGGVGVWGTTPMRAHPTLSLDDAKKMVVWILSTGEVQASTGAQKLLSAGLELSWNDWRRYALNLESARPFVLATLHQQGLPTERTADTELETEAKE